MSIHEKKHSLKMRLAYEHYQRVFQGFFSRWISNSSYPILKKREEESLHRIETLAFEVFEKKILAVQEEEGEGESAHR